MSGFMNPDGSELVGGQLPSTVGQALSLDAQGNLKTTATVTPPSSAVSTGNSTTTPLALGATFTGAWESALAYGSISVQVFADQASAASGLIIEQSQDGTNADTQAASSVLASTAFQQTVNLTGQYFRVVYTNGGSNQGTFRLQTIKEVYASPSAGVANQRVNAHAGDFVAGSISDLSTLPASLTELLTDTDNLATIAANTADLLADGDNLATIATNTTGVATAANQTTGNTSLSGIKTDLDEIALDTDNLASILTQDTTTATNTTTLAGVVSGGKAAVRATTAGDFVDGADVALGTTTQTKATDGSATSWSVIQLLKGIFDKLLGSIAVTGTFWQATQPVSGTVTASTPTAASATLTSVASNASAVSLLASNGSRKWAACYNDSTQILYLGLVAHASLTTANYTVQVGPNGFWEMPPGIDYTGEISGIWASANGNARLTEI